MAQALITVNAVVGSDDDVPINALVQLDNQNAGGEVSYAWLMLDRPPGSAAALSSASLQNPTFTPDIEGTYLIELTVNAGLGDQASNRVIVAVRQLKSMLRVPAVGETTENGARGWDETGAGAMLRELDGRTLMGLTMITAKNSGGDFAVFDVVEPAGWSEIPAGPSGNEAFATSELVDGTVAAAGLPMMIVTRIGLPEGLAQAMLVGFVQNAPITAPVLNGDVYVNASGQLTMTVTSRRCGKVLDIPALNTANIFFKGL